MYLKQHPAVLIRIGWVTYLAGMARDENRNDVETFRNVL
jgi:hypothetical protein